MFEWDLINVQKTVIFIKFPPNKALSFNYESADCCYSVRRKGFYKKWIKLLLLQYVCATFKAVLQASYLTQETYKIRAQKLRILRLLMLCMLWCSCLKRHISGTENHQFAFFSFKLIRVLNKIKKKKTINFKNSGPHYQWHVKSSTGRATQYYIVP